ncbi:unnamed protein product [Euphydryas editha]|uniref:Uncharacterized protein n=1 Tax=Euphydryas editha TaxID=104508 RepID=A0AAU9V893_EUPED|nr:unnamed protein product [Euphydryas editha]
MPTEYNRRTDREEKALCDYLVTCAFANFGLSTKEARRFAYRLALAYNQKCSFSWSEREMAGKVMTIYDIPGIVKTSFDIVVIPRNICSGFSATEVWAVITDRPTVITG